MVPGEPFRIEVPQATLDDLTARLARTRWPVPPAGHGWAFGAALPFMQDVVAHWRDRFDWRAWEARFNAHEQYLVPLGGLKVHVLLERGSGPDPMPIVLTHGWPGSQAELIELVEPLAHPERFGGDVRDAFTVVVPSLPGVGFSQSPPAPVSPREIAGMWAELMRERLGFSRYMAHGGDWGASISSFLALDHGADLAGLHLTMGALRQTSAARAPMTDEEQAYAARVGPRMEGESAYQMVHATKPLSLGYGLADSPAGLAAWILEKFHGWTTPGVDAAPPFELDHLIANVMFYWLGDPVGASLIYRFLADRSGFVLPEGRKIEVPTAFQLFPQDIAVPPPDSWLAQSYKMQRVRRAPSGGHFPGLENAGLLVEDLRAFRRELAG